MGTGKRLPGHPAISPSTHGKSFGPMGSRLEQSPKAYPQALLLQSSCLSQTTGRGTAEAQMRKEGRSCSQTVVSGQQSLSTRDGASGTVYPADGRCTTGLPEAMVREGQALWQDMMGGIPGVPAGDLGESWPPLCSPLLPPPLTPAHPCSPRAPAWNPGWPRPPLPRPAQPSCHIRHSPTGGVRGSS